MTMSRLGVDALMMGVIGSQFLRYLSITERESLYIKLFIARSFLPAY